MQLFDYLKRLKNKQPIEEPPEQFEKDFSVFMVNRFMACDRNTVMLANAMNRSGITKQMVFDFYDHLIPKTGGFSKYSMKKESADKKVKYVMQWFGCSLQTAKEYGKLLSDEEMASIVQHFEKERK